MSEIEQVLKVLKDNDRLKSAGLGAGIGAVANALSADTQKEMVKGAAVGAATGIALSWLIDQFDFDETKNETLEVSEPPKAE